MLGTEGHECATPALPGPQRRGQLQPGAGRARWGRASRPKAEGLLPVCGLLTEASGLLIKPPCSDHEAKRQTLMHLLRAPAQGGTCRRGPRS